MLSPDWTLDGPLTGPDLCSHAGCDHTVGDGRNEGGLCPTCALELELFDRETRWERIRRATAR